MTLSVFVMGDDGGNWHDETERPVILLSKWLPGGDGLAYKNDGRTLAQIRRHPGS